MDLRYFPAARVSFSRLGVVEMPDSWDQAKIVVQSLKTG